MIKQYRLKNTNKVILAHLNINSIRNKFSCLKELVSDNIDVLVIEETKLDETFPEKAFMIPGYKKPFRKEFLTAKYFDYMHIHIIKNIFFFIAFY